MQVTDKSAHLVVSPHPLTAQGQVSVSVLMHDGETLLSVLQRHDVGHDWIVEVGGLRVPAIMWDRTRVHHAQVIECRRAVHEDVVKIVAFAALAYFTMGAGTAWLATATGLSGVGLAVAGALVFAAGAAVINSVLPPPSKTAMDMVSNTTEPTYSLSGGRNQGRLWQPMSLVLGQPYVVPDMAAQPYTYFSGEDQYLVQHFHAGLNCYDVTNLRIGQTGVEDYQGVSIRQYGLPSGRFATGLPDANVDAISGALLDAPTATGPWVQRTSSVDTVFIGIDIEASIYSVNSGNGAYESRTVELDVQYSVAGSGNWVGVSTGTETRVKSTSTETDESGGSYLVDVWTPVAAPAGKAYLTHASTKPLRVGFGVSVPKGQYDVRLRKVTANEASTSAQNTVTWTQLKSTQVNPTSYPGQTIVCTIIKASGQLSGAIADFNWIATAKPTPFWNGSAWVTATSRANGLSNPGAQILQLARGIYDENNRLIAGLGWPDSRIDVDGLKRFMVWCTAKGFTFDAIIQEPMTHDDLMTAIAYAGMATINWADGKLGVQWLDDAAPVEGVINMGNIKAKSFSVAYATNDRAQEIEYGYFDRAQNNQWNSLRVLMPGVTNPSATARLSNMGITTEAHAALLARHAMAQNIYMAKSITFDQDLEFLTYRRGTVLALSHDLTQWGYSGRVQSAVNASGVVTLTLDDAIPATGPGGSSSRYMGLRLVGETQYRIFTVAAFTGTTRTVTLSGTWPAGVALPGANGQPMDALWIFDFKATPGQRVVVTKIEPSENQGGARVSVSPLPDEFWPYVLSGAYTPPPNRSLLNALPSITAARVSEILKRQGNTFFTELTASFDVSSNCSEVRVTGAANGAALQFLGTTPSRQFTWVGGLSEVWDIELTPYNDLGQPGDKYRVSYTIQGLTVPPSNVTGLGIAVEKAGIRVYWTACTDTDYAETIVKIGTSWDSAVLLAKKTSNSHLIEWQSVGTLKVWAAHVDTTGNISTTPASASITITAPTAVTGLLLASGTTGLQATWAMPAQASTAQPVDRVELSWSSNFATIIDAKKATTATFPWRAPGLAELFVRVVDVAGNVGPSAMASLTVRSPSAPVSLSMTVGNSGVSANWLAPAVASDQQPLDGVQLSWLPNFAALIETRTATSVTLGWLAAGTYTLYARYTDAAGNSGTAASVTLTVAAPSAPTALALAFGTASIETKWTAPAVAANQQPLDRVELSWGSAFTTIIDGKKSTTTTFGWMPSGTYTLYARYVDMAGNVGAVSQTDLTVQAPAQPTMTAVETQVNAVTLRWQDAKSSQPIRKYAIYYAEAGTAIGSALLYGSAGADSRSDILFYRSAGSKVAYLVAEDVAGNLSTPRQIDLTIKMPNDFVLASEYYEDWQTGELTNGTIVGGSTGQIILPANNNRTWGQRLRSSTPSYPAWYFSGTPLGWSPGGAVHSMDSNGFLTHSSTTIDPMLISPAVSINGASYNRVQLKVTRLSGSGWAGQLFYSNQYHGFSEAYSLFVPNPNLGVNETAVIEWNMSSSSIDWVGSTVSIIRVDLGQSPTDAFRIDFVRVLPPSGALDSGDWDNAQQKVDAGYPIVVQPVPASGKHVEQKDLGKVLAVGVVRVTPILQSSVAGYTATIRIRGSNGDTNASWQSWLVGDAASISNFRYLEVEYSVTSDGKGFVVLDDLSVKVEITEVTESTTLVLSASDVAGTSYTTTKPFLDVRTAQATPLGSSNIAKLNCIVDDSVLPARVFVQAWDSSNNRTSGTVSLFIAGV